MCLSKATPAPKSGSFSSDIFYVPTFAAEKPPKQMDMRDLDSSDKLLELKKKDPFFYYSLPPVHDAVMHGKSADPSSVQNQVTSEAALGAETGSEERRIVKRRSCLSFESHDSCVLEELIAANSTNASAFAEDDRDFLDIFISYVPGDVPQPSTKRSKHE